MWPPKPKLLDRAMFDLRLAGGVGDVVEVALVVGVVEVERGRDDAVVDGHGADDQLDAAGGAQQVAGGALGGGDHQAVVGVVAEGLLDGLGLGQVAQFGAGAVGVDVVDVARG